jgi:hypothetical protein
LMGQSGGGVCVHALSVSPMAQGTCILSFVSWLVRFTVFIHFFYITYVSPISIDSVAYYRCESLSFVFQHSNSSFLFCLFFVALFFSHLQEINLLRCVCTGLFQSGISMSGSMFVMWGFNTRGRPLANKLASALDCPTNTSHAILNCLLHQRGAKEITSALQSMFVSSVWIT